MKAQELRTGNWVKDHGDTGKSYQVTEITQDGFIAGPMQVYPAGMHYEWGIPLTSEWLERFGFTYRTDHRGDGMLMDLKKDGEIIAAVGFSSKGIKYLLAWSAPLQYVHQLQNLYFAMTGTELTLNPSPEQI